MRGGGSLALGGSTARLSTEALGPCFRRVICRGMKEDKPPASAAQVAFFSLELLTKL